MANGQTVSPENLLRLKRLRQDPKFEGLSPQIQSRVNDIITANAPDPLSPKGLTATGALIAETIGGTGVEALKEKGEQLRRRVVAPTAKALSTAALGIPEAILERVSPETAQALLPEPEGVAETALQFGAGALGFARGAALGVGKKVAGEIAKRAPKLIPKTGRRISAVELGIAGGLQTPQDSSFADLKARASASGTSAILGGIIPARSVPLPKDVIPGKRAKLAGSIINRLIRPRQKQMSYGKNPGAAVAQEGIVANTLEGLVSKIGDRVGVVGEKISFTMAQFGGKAVVNMSGVLTPINNALTKARQTPGTNAALIKRLETAKKDIVKLIGKKKDALVSPQRAFEVKQAIGQMTKWTSEFGDDTIVNGALKQTYSSTKRQIESIIPSIKPLNDRYANLITAKAAGEARVASEAAKGAGIGLTDTILGASTGIGVAAPGGFSITDIIPATTMAAGVIGLKRALTSTALRSRLASFIGKTPQRNRDKIFTRFPQLKEAIDDVFGSVDDFIAGAELELLEE